MNKQKKIEQAYILNTELKLSNRCSPKVMSWVMKNMVKGFTWITLFGIAFVIIVIIEVVGVNHEPGSQYLKYWAFYCHH